MPCARVLRKASSFAPICLLASMMVTSLPFPLGSAVLRVQPVGSDGNLGHSWAAAKRTVSAALIQAQPGDVIWVGAGICADRISLKRVSLYGGFTGTDARDPRSPFHLLASIASKSHRNLSWIRLEPATTRRQPNLPPGILSQPFS
jgi:hypothetical protein